MKDEYIIINKTAIQNRIEELKESLAISEANNDNIRAGIESFEIKQLEWCLSQSTPLIPEIKKAFNAGGAYTLGSYKEFTQTHPDKTEYISNLKLNI